MTANTCLYGISSCMFAHVEALILGESACDRPYLTATRPHTHPSNVSRETAEINPYANAKSTLIRSHSRSLTLSPADMWKYVSSISHWSTLSAPGFSRTNHSPVSRWLAFVRRARTLLAILGPPGSACSFGRQYALQRGHPLGGARCLRVCVRYSFKTPKL